jgi:hypothetical protein
MELSYARPKAMSEKGGAAAAVSALTAKAKLAGMWREKDAWVAADVVRIEDGKDLGALSCLSRLRERIPMLRYLHRA